MANEAIGYVRVSSEEQKIEGVSLAAQQEQIRAYCVLKKMCLREIIVDAGVSGGKPLGARDGGKRVLTSKANTIVASKLDRLFRDAADCLAVTRAWDKKGIALHLLDLGGNSLDTSSAMGRMFLTMASGFAELERGLVKERTRSALKEKRRQGKLAGAVPYGYTLAEDGETLVTNQQEQDALTLIQEMNSARMPFRKIARELESRGIRTKKGHSTWQASSVRSVLAHAAPKTE